MFFILFFLSVFPFHTTWKFNFSQLNVRLSCFFFIAAFAMLLFILHVFLFSIDVHGIIFQFFCFLYFFREQNIFFCFTFISYATHYFPALYLPLHNVISFIFLNTFYLLIFCQFYHLFFYSFTTSCLTLF